MRQGDARLPSEEQSLVRDSQGGEGKERLAGQAVEALHAGREGLAGRGGACPRANGMPGFSRAKMKDVPEEG